MKAATPNMAWLFSRSHVSDAMHKEYTMASLRTCDTRMTRGADRINMPLLSHRIQTGATSRPLDIPLMSRQRPIWTACAPEAAPPLCYGSFSSGWSEPRLVAACYSVLRSSKQSQPRVLGHIQLPRLQGSTFLSSAAGRDPETDESLPPELSQWGLSEVYQKTSM